MTVLSKVHPCTSLMNKATACHEETHRPDIGGGACCKKTTTTQSYDIMVIDYFHSIFYSEATSSVCQCTSALEACDSICFDKPNMV